MAVTHTKVIACIPHFRCKHYIRRAVKSLLLQTFENLAVVVVNDGDPDPPWDQLADIRDPRLYRFSLRTNHGPYFATAVVLNATTAPYLLIQDADDWSAPDRVAQLLNRLERDHSDLAVSAQPQHQECGEDSTKPSRVLWRSPPTMRLTPQFEHHASHAGLFRAHSLRNVGGYYGGFRICYDMLLTNLILMTGKISHVRAPLYHRLVRPESLTHSSFTGKTSATAAEVSGHLGVLYAACFSFYCKYLAGHMSSEKLSASIRSVCGRYLSADDKKDLNLEANRLISRYPFLASPF